MEPSIAAIYKPNQNPERFFGGGLQYKQLVGMNFEQLAHAFDGRIKSWFVNPIRLLIGDKIGPNGFQVTQQCCMLIDILRAYPNINSLRGESPIL